MKDITLKYIILLLIGMNNIIFSETNYLSNTINNLKKKADIALTELYNFFQTPAGKSVIFSVSTLGSAGALTLILKLLSPKPEEQKQFLTESDDTFQENTQNILQNTSTTIIQDELKNIVQEEKENSQEKNPEINTQEEQDLLKILNDLEKNTSRNNQEPEEREEEREEREPEQEEKNISSKEQINYDKNNKTKPIKKKISKIKKNKIQKKDLSTKKKKYKKKNTSPIAINHKNIPEEREIQAQPTINMSPENKDQSQKEEIQNNNNIISIKELLINNHEEEMPSKDTLKPTMPKPSKDKTEYHATAKIQKKWRENLMKKKENEILNANQVSLKELNSNNEEEEKNSTTHQINNENENESQKEEIILKYLKELKFAGLPPKTIATAIKYAFTENIQSSQKAEPILKDLFQEILFNNDPKYFIDFMKYLEVVHVPQNLLQPYTEEASYETIKEWMEKHLQENILEEINKLPADEDKKNTAMNNLIPQIALLGDNPIILAALEEKKFTDTYIAELINDFDVFFKDYHNIENSEIHEHFSEIHEPINMELK